MEKVETIKLSNPDLFESLNGLWKGKKPPFVKAKVIRNTNFTKMGVIDYSDVVELDVEKKQLEKKHLNRGDIIVERSGGSPAQPVGRVVFFDKDETDFSFSNFTSAIRVKDQEHLFPKYVFYFLKYFYDQGATEELQQRTTGIRNLDFNTYKDKTQIPFLPMTGQKNISYILSKIQEAIENQDKIIKATTDLKAALMKKIFSEGLNGEALKETEIGKIPKSWKAKKIKDLVLKTETRNPENNPEKIIKYIDVSSVSSQLLKIVEPQILKGKDAPGRARKIVLTNDVIFATVRPTLKRVCKITSEYNNEYCSTAFCVLRANKSILNYEFLFQYLTSDDFIKRTEKLQSGASYPAITDEKLKAMEMPLPSLNEQEQISNVLKLIDDKYQITHRKNQAHQNLFNSLLNNLMSGEMQVNNLKI